MVVVSSDFVWCKIEAIKGFIEKCSFFSTKPLKNTLTKIPFEKDLFVYSCYCSETVRANIKHLLSRFTFVAHCLKHCGLWSGLFHFDSLVTMPEPALSSGGFPLNLSKWHALLFERLSICNSASVLLCCKPTVNLFQLEQLRMAKFYWPAAIEGTQKLLAFK